MWKWNHTPGILQQKKKNSVSSACRIPWHALSQERGGRREHGIISAQVQSLYGKTQPLTLFVGIGVGFHLPAYRHQTREYHELTSQAGGIKNAGPDVFTQLWNELYDPKQIPHTATHHYTIHIS